MNPKQKEFTYKSVLENNSNQFTKFSRDWVKKALQEQSKQKYQEILKILRSENTNSARCLEIYDKIDKWVEVGK